MAGTNILVRQKDLIAGSGISITPDTTSGNVTIAATSTAIDESRLVPTGGKEGEILSYQEGVDQGNGSDVRLLLQNAMTDSANGNAAPAAVTTQGVTLTGDNNLLFDGNDSHVTAVLATDEIFAADKEWTIDFWMKPTANSSDWNYILTENRGDWGSHSIGLTWHKSTNVLEQDTGGYVASVIKAPNWPNNSTPCAADQWHFVAVEKQKTASGWNLNYYLNGAIWLQVAFTADFVPFDASDNPFWFGGKTTDSGRWFKGEVNKLRVTMGARYGGKAFAVPDRLTDYAAPAGQPVWKKGIDRSRLLPENPANGDIPCFDATATVGGGNDENTRLLLQPSTSDHGIVDQAAGNAAPVTLENHNVTVDEEGNMVFDGSNAYLKIPANTLPSDFFNGTDEWTLDIVYNVASKGMQCLFGCSSSLRMDFLLDSDGSLQIGAGPNLGTGWPFNEDVHLTFEIYKDGTVWKYTIFRNGSVVTTGTWVNADWRSVAQYVGWEGESDSRKINGKIKALRLTSGALHKGAAFQSDYPWTRPQTVGEWGKLNKSKLVKSVNGQLPDSSGVVTLPAATASAAGLMAATDKAAIAGLTAQGIYPNAAVAAAGSGIDYNLFKTQGTFYIPYHTAVSNGPVSAGSNGVYPGGFLSILQANLSGGTSVQQIFHQHASNNAYIRSYNGDLDIWTDWQRTVTDTDITALTTLEANYLNKHAAFDNADMNTVTELGAFWGRFTNNLPVSSNASPYYAIQNAPYGVQSGVVQIACQVASNFLFYRYFDMAKTSGTWQRLLTETDQYSQKVVTLADFNDYKIPGEYFFYTAAHLNSPDAPNNTAGWLVVEAVSGGEYAKQTYYALNTRKTYIRTYNNNNHTWLPWHQQLSIADITESKARPGYFKLPGGTIVQWGAASNITADGRTQITFPVAFPNAFLIGNATAVSGNASASGVVVSLSATLSTGMILITKNHPGNDKDINVHWIAIGY